MGKHTVIRINKEWVDIQINLTKLEKAPIEKGHIRGNLPEKL